MATKPKLTASNVGKRLLEDESKFIANANHLLIMSVSLTVSLASEVQKTSTIMDIVLDSMLFYILVGVLVYAIKQMVIYYVESDRMTDKSFDRWKYHIMCFTHTLSLLSVAAVTTGMVSFGMIVSRMMDNKPDRRLFLILQFVIAASLSGIAVLLGYVKTNRQSLHKDNDLS